MAGGRSNLPSWARGGGAAHGNPNLPSWAQAPATVTPTSAHKSGGGGIFGSIGHAFHTAESATQHALRKTEDKTASISTGLYSIGKAEGQAISDDLHGRNAKVNKAEWNDIFHGHFIRAFQESKNPANHATSAAKQVAGIERSIGSSYKQSVEHPLRDPVSTALNALPLVSGGITAIGKAAYVGSVAKAARVAETGDLVEQGSAAAKAAETAGHTVVPLTRAEKAKLAAKVASPRTRLPATERTLTVPKLVNPAGEGPAELTGARVQIGTAASTGIGRAAQGLHDAVAQKALDRGATASKQTRTARYAERRVAGAVGELSRTTANVRNADVARITAAAAHLDRGVGRRAGQLAMFLRSANVTGKEAADYWKAQAASGVGGRRVAALAKLADGIHQQGILKLGDDNKVAVDATKFPKLAVADRAVAAGQETRANILAERGLMTPEGMQKRLDLVGQHMLGDKAREGQGFVSLKTSAKRAAQSPIARSRGPIVPLTKALSVGKRATGKGISKGLVPASTTNTVARGLRDALRFVNSDDLRGNVAKLGSDVKRTGDDVLIRDPAATKAADVPEHIKQMLGQSESTVTETSGETLRAAGRKLLEEHIPGLADDFERDQAAGLGERAPLGHKWVPKQLLPGELTKSVEARGRVEKFADTVNSAVTSATVYLKLGHLPTRAFTNATTNIVQGAGLPTPKFLQPLEIGKNATLAHRLTDSQKTDLLAATGTHGYEALPHAGTGTIARIATKSSSAWARHIDAPFRLNATLHELRERGFDTTEKIDQAIKELKNPGTSGMNAAQLSKLHAAVRESNRASIMYDGMSVTEKRYIARYMWFYPWTKGAARFAGRTVVQHPVKAAALSAIGQQGSNYRNSILGPVPGYEFSLTPYTHGNEPLTGNISSYTPFSTVDTVAAMLAHPLNKDAGVLGQLNPYNAALATLIGESFAGKKHAVSDALNEAVQPTPEAQVWNARKPPSPTQMFGVAPFGVHNPRTASLLSVIARALGGAAVPRPTRRSELARAAHKHPG